LFEGSHGRLRVVERLCRDLKLAPSQSGFNLIGAAQVGKSNLTGMRMLSRIGGRVPIWPFDPVPAKGPLIVEIYTTIAAQAAGITGGSKVRSAASLDKAMARLGSRPHDQLPRYDDHSTEAILTAAWLPEVTQIAAPLVSPGPHPRTHSHGGLDLRRSLTHGGN
jgi:hypothetical protein